MCFKVMTLKLSIAILFLSVLQTSCNGNGGNSLPKDTSAQLEVQRQDSIREANAEAERIKKEKELSSNYSKWKYETETDPMTDEVSRSAKLYSINQHYINGAETPLGIYIYQSDTNDKPVVLMGVGDWCVFRNNMPLLYYRFDGGKMEQQSYLATAKNVIFIGDDNWVEMLKHSKKLACKIELADGSTQTFEFDTRGLEW